LLDTHDDNVNLNESVIKGIQNGDFSPKPPLILKSNVNPRFRTRNENVMIPGRMQGTEEHSDISEHEDDSDLKIVKKSSA
jgi:hypothetical protein